MLTLSIFSFSLRNIQRINNLELFSLSSCLFFIVCVCKSYFLMGLIILFYLNLHIDSNIILYFTLRSYFFSYSMMVNAVQIFLRRFITILKFPGQRRLQFPPFLWFVACPRDPTHAARHLAPGDAPSQAGPFLPPPCGKPFHNSPAVLSLPRYHLSASRTPLTTLITHKQFPCRCN